MSLIENKKDNGAGAFVTIEIMIFRKRDLFSNVKIEQKTGLCQSEDWFQVGAEIAIKLVKSSRIYEAKALVMKC